MRAVTLLLAIPVFAIIVMALLGPPSVLVTFAFSLFFAAACGGCTYYARKEVAARLGVLILALAVTCFLATMAEEFVLGGTPLNGKVTEQGYFVGSHGHHRLVAEKVYRVGLAFNLGLGVFWPAMFVFAAVDQGIARRDLS